MANEKRRILHEFYILSQEEDYINSSELAQIVKVTERTIKSDMKELENFAMASGTRLISKKGSGYKLDVLDDEVFLPVKEQLAYRFLSDRVLLFTSSDLQQRTNDILRRIIVEEKFIKIDDIAEELYLTKSAITEELKEVNRVLKSFNLRIKKKNEEGPLVLGKEFDRRLLMVRIFETHYHKAMTFFKYSEYSRNFEREESERLEIRQILLRVLRGSNLHIYDDFTQRISRYLVLSSNRHREGYILDFSEEEKAFIRKFKQFEVAIKLVQKLQVFEGFDYDDNEVYGVALLFMFWVDLDADSDLKKDYAPVYDEAYDLVVRTRNSILNDYNMDISKIESWDRILLTSVIQLVIQLKFNCANNSIQAVGVISQHVRYSPLSIALAREINYVLHEKYDIWFSMYNLLFIANRIYFIINRIGYDFKEIRASIVSMNGLEAAKAIKMEVEFRVGDYFEKLDVHELYELRGVPTEEYDWVLLSIPYFSYKYEWPYILIDMIPTTQQMNDLYNQVVLSGVQLQPVIDQIGIEKIDVYRNFEFDSLDSFIKLLCFRLGQSCDDIERLSEFFKHSLHGCCFNKVAVLFIPNSLVHKQIIEVYQLESKATWLNEEVELIMVLSLDFKDNLQMVRMMEQFTNECMSDPEQLWLLIENPRIEFISEIIKQKLKSKPISLVKGK